MRSPKSQKQSWMAVAHLRACNRIGASPELAVVVSNRCDRKRLSAVVALGVRHQHHQVCGFCQTCARTIPHCHTMSERSTQHTLVSVRYRQEDKKSRKDRLAASSQKVQAHPPLSLVGGGVCEKRRATTRSRFRCHLLLPPTPPHSLFSLAQSQLCECVSGRVRLSLLLCSRRRRRPGSVRSRATRPVCPSVLRRLVLSSVLLSSSLCLSARASQSKQDQPPNKQPNCSQRARLLATSTSLVAIPESAFIHAQHHQQAPRNPHNTRRP